jgi:hypothetical protein
MTEPGTEALSVDEPEDVETPAFVYALGRVVPRFPSLAVEKEFAQATARTGAAGLSDQQTFEKVLTDRSNRYLVRQLCWIFMVEGIETYVLAPRDPLDLDLLVDAIRPQPNPNDLDLVVGVLGPLAPPDACGGVAVPIVAFDQLHSFDRAELLDAIPLPASSTSAAAKEQFAATAAELLDRVLQLADNVGAVDEHRALNYLAVRYPAIYARTAEAHEQNSSLMAVEVRPSRLRGVRSIVDVILSYRHRQTDVVDKSFVRVDVTEEFPFLVSKLAPFYDR